MSVFKENTTTTTNKNTNVTFAAVCAALPLRLHARITSLIDTSCGSCVFASAPLLRVRGFDDAVELDVCDVLSHSLSAAVVVCCAWCFEGVAKGVTDRDLNGVIPANARD